MTAFNKKQKVDSRYTGLHDRPIYLSDIKEILNTSISDGTGIISIKEFGAQGDGITDDTNIFLNIISFLHSNPYYRLYIPIGRYILKQELIFPKNTMIEGNGLGSILDFTGADPSLFQTYGAAITIAASSPVLLNTLVIPKFGDIALTPSNGFNVNENDTLMIWDTVSSSYSNFDPNYCQGEIVDVSINSTFTNINLKGRIQGHLYQNSPNIYKMETSYGSIANLTVIAPLGIAVSPYNTGVSPICFQYLTSGDIHNVNVNNSDYCGITINKCYNVSITKCNVNKNQYDTDGLSYGIVVSNSQKVTIRDSIISASRQAITTGGNQFFAIVCRQILIDNCTCNTTGGVEALGFHGNIEYSGVTNSFINGGIIIAGRMNYFDHNVITQADTGPGNGGLVNGLPITLGGILEPSISITNNKIISYAKPNSNAIWLQWSHDDNTTIVGTLIIRDNEFFYSNKYSATNNPVGITIICTGSTSNNVNAQVIGNRFINNDSISTNSFNALRFTGKAGQLYDKVIIKDNEFVNSIFVTSYHNKLQVINNEMHKPLIYGMNISNTTDLVCNYNNIYNFNVVTSGSSNTDAAITISTCTKVKAVGNSGFSNTSNLGRYAIALNTVTNFIGADNIFTNLIIRTYNFLTVTTYDVARLKFTSTSVNFPSTAAQTSSDIVVTASGVDLGDVISIGVPLASDTSNSCYTASCVVAGQIRLRFNNYSSAAIDPGAGIFKFIVDKI